MHINYLEIRFLYVNLQLSVQNSRLLLISTFYMVARVTDEMFMNVEKYWNQHLAGSLSFHTLTDLQKGKNVMFFQCML